MELNNYKSVTPLKKKRKKITASATLVLCILCLLIGVLCGKAASTKQSKDEISKQISDLKFEHSIKVTQMETEIATRDDEINRLKKEIAEANNNLAASEPEVVAPEVTPDDGTATADDTKDAAEKKSGGFGKTLLIIILLVVIGGCIFVGVRIFMRRNDEDYDDDEYDDDEEYDDYDDDEYEDDEYDDEEYDDEEYDEEDDEE